MMNRSLLALLPLLFWNACTTVDSPETGRMRLEGAWVLDHKEERIYVGDTLVLIAPGEAASDLRAVIVHGAYLERFSGRADTCDSRIRQSILLTNNSISIVDS